MLDTHAISEIAGLVAQINPVPVVGNKRLRGSAGRYHVDGEFIDLAADIDRTTCYGLGVLVHEIGHALDFGGCHPASVELGRPPVGRGAANRMRCELAATAFSIGWARVFFVDAGQWIRDELAYWRSVYRYPDEEAHRRATEYCFCWWRERKLMHLSMDRVLWTGERSRTEQLALI